MSKTSQFMLMIFIVGISILLSGCYTVINQSAFSGPYHHNRHAKKVLIKEEVVTVQDVSDQDEDSEEYYEETEQDEVIGKNAENSEIECEADYEEEESCETEEKIYITHHYHYDDYYPRYVYDPFWRSTYWYDSYYYYDPFWRFNFRPYRGYYWILL